jgi:hypothetical protein
MVSHNHLGVVMCLKSLLSSAIERSWTTCFAGDSLNLLKKHVHDQMRTTGMYARYNMIIQSSGMGKSRLLDEFSKHHFLIPINLRPEGSEGVSCSFQAHGLSNRSLRLSSSRQ